MTPLSSLHEEVKARMQAALRINAETGKRSPDYPHAVSFSSVADLKDVTITARGLNCDFGWAQGKRNPEFEEQLTKFSRHVIDKIAERNAHCACAFGRLRSIKNSGVSVDEDTLHELRNFDVLVQATEKLMAAHRVLSTPTEVGTFGIVPPPTINSTLKDIICTMENFHFVPISMVYELALEVLDA